MSGKSGGTKKKTDDRTRRTRDRLGDALVALMLEKPFDTITVQDVLDRAHVGRSTFYAHFRDKDDLFVSDADEFLDAMANHLSRVKEAGTRVAPVREFLAHIAEMHRLHAALAASGRLSDFLELAQGHFARAIEGRLAALRRGPQAPAGERAAEAQALAGAMLSMMSWWLDKGMPLSAEQMDDLFHRMVWNGAGVPAGAPAGRG